MGAAERAAIIEYYCNGHSSRETARRFGLSKTAVLNLLLSHEVSPRPPHFKETGALPMHRPLSSPHEGEKDAG